eukprot:TRINITY_DN145_c0_g1_i1.p2 TRINITY_DN145_c0_g1~~TRINITY_DN145_c0_g1_i1.p2  ORF type:complete len:385 (+),score=89.90 TRINITY_DN145_c0_g1_i1:144-1157(+)
MAARYPGPRLIATSENTKQWMDYYQVLELVNQNIGFRDVTDEQDAVPTRPQLRRAFPSAPSQQQLFEAIAPFTSIDRWSTTVQYLSSYSTRHCNSNTGVTAANWIRDQFLAAANGRADVSVSLEPTTGFQQPSVIAILQGEIDEIVVYGGHEDSISSGSTAPGADDDASGTAAVLEVFRAFMEAGFRPRRSIHFIAYSCEELGLIGSGQIARKYASAGAPVYGVIQNDMIGWAGTDGAYGLITDFTDADLNAFIRIVTDAGNYTALNYVNSRCNYGCSDHASWTNQGYAAAFTFEAAFADLSPYIHTTGDTFARVDPNHAYEILKLALGLVLELAQA